MDGLSKKMKPKVTVTSPTNLDLEQYIQNYTGRTRITRLLFIEEACPSLRPEALTLVVELIKADTYDVILYKSCIAKLQSLDPSVQCDHKWVDETSRYVRNQTEKLEAELKQYKTNLIKESIRIANLELGDFYYKCGDLDASIRSYNRSRDYCSSTQQQVDLAMKLIVAYAELHNMTSISTSSGKVIASIEEEQKSILEPKMKAAVAIVYLDGGRYKDAADSFLSLPPDLKYDEAYSKLKDRVINNTDVRTFLELEPYTKELIQSFYNAKYSVCFDILRRYKPDFLLDIYLSEHVEKLYNEIKERAVTQYFQPFTSVSMEKMAEAFGWTYSEIFALVKKLVQDGKMEARIDTILVSKIKDDRTKLYEQTNALKERFEEDSRVILMNVNIVRAGLEVKAPQTPQAAQN
ncbi:COP9 signalosome complex subunit 1 [Neolecta irregularis DAH-3]|uniref:COP9 signalosome complex subunit 1 n=1 Tax=Neolecta irregularis (strain DAH-3) TaxID=1198029 RepID=A0A1U7LP86_NEOID|nr:COP9 signalosome complex subunit 1 [Neolecta irregularis DAH-3]|eukprot:OLL24403.1 COP9 signalosome complex subunit 1 [Neolecta irregularis DAH-3]